MGATPVFIFITKLKGMVVIRYGYYHVNKRVFV
jgi:hypothetical protein